MSSPTARSKESEMEVWLAISGFEGVYEVSSLGNVRSLDRIDASGHRRKGKLLALSHDQDGYLLCGLTTLGRVKSFKVHRLVAGAFLENPQQLPHVNHIDGSKQNNAAVNLEWVTHRQNKAHAKENGLTARGTRSGRHILKPEQVNEIRAMTEAGMGPKAISQALGVGLSSVNHVRQGRCWGWHV